MLSTYYHLKCRHWLFPLFFVFAMLSIGSACQSKKNTPVEKTETFGTGEVSRRYHEINGKIEGKMIDYYPGGKLKAERWFQNNIQVGRTVLYYPSGRVKEIQHYLDGKKEGGDSLYYENGRLEFIVEYHQEKKNGYMRKWAPDGNLVIEARYAMDSLVEVKGQPVQIDYPATLKGVTGRSE